VASPVQDFRQSGQRGVNIVAWRCAAAALPALDSAPIYGGRTAMADRYVRLTEPLVRENGKLRPATWEEALNRAAGGFQTAVERYGPTTFGMFSCSKATNEVNYLAQKFTRQV